MQGKHAGMEAFFLPIQLSTTSIYYTCAFTCTRFFLRIFSGLCRTISNIYVDFMESNPLAPPSINHSMWTPHNLLSIPYTSFRGLKTFKARTSGRLNDVIISMHLHIKNWKIFNRIIYSSSEYICLQ